MDTVDPSRVRSMGGKWYVLVIIDDYSCYSWVFFLESKNEVFEHFQSLALRLNNEHSNCLKVIRNDNGTEFRNASFDEFCLEHGINQQFSTPRVPQQNGVVKRKNCTLVEMARMMLDEHRTPRRFWADAISTVCYISNRIFLRLILHLTPFELRFGHKLSVSYLRPFGWKCFVLKCGNLDKFESRSFDGILLGYTPHGRSYRVYNLQNNTVVESCDMTFDETAPYPCDVFECAGDKEMDESIFVDEGLQGVNGDEDEPLLPSTSSPEHVPASTLEAEAPQATTSSCTSQRHSRIFSSLWGYVRAFRLPHALHIGRQFSKSLGISNTPLSLGFGILFLLRLILLAFSMLILRIVGLTERALLTLVIFLNLLSFAGLLESSLLLHSPPPRSSM
jgi:hypothetical protein